MISNVTFMPPAITTETTGLTTGTSVSFYIDTPGQVTINIVGSVQNYGDAGTAVGNLINYYPVPGTPVPGTQTVFWPGLWLIGGDLGRIDGSYQFTLTLSTTAGSYTTPTPSSPQVTITSVDIHNMSVTPSLDSNGNPIAPYVIKYSLAKQAAVTVSVSSGTTLVRTIISNKVQYAESVSSVTVNWDGLQNNGTPAPIGIYTVQVQATDQTNGDQATPRTRQIGVTSLAGAESDPQQLFEQNAFVYPNPVRNGQGIFQFESIRDGATISLRIYTITGTLVLDESFSLPSAGTTQTFTWNAANQSGHKVGRGLYYYVIRESDSVGTLQTVKKMAVLP